MNIYAKNILDHYKNPRNRGALKDASVSFKSLNSTCGDQIEVFLKVEAGKIKKINFEGHGCAISIATISILSEALLEKKVSEVLKLDLNSVQSLLGIEISARRSKCALIGLKAIKGALKKETR
ncbi:iron-sulfur cluster assembly scaffold protein [Patescibacteria group bacterium]|nr:iron-sulfur cluster assembly scaffold protein [Patescibacteria group bacterium]